MSRFSSAVFAAGFLLNAPGISKLVTIPGLTPASHVLPGTVCTRHDGLFLLQASDQGWLTDDEEWVCPDCAGFARRMYSGWQPAGTDEPRDQQRDLFDGCWAEVGPDTRFHPDGWTWNILHSGNNPALAAELGQGFTVGEDDAKTAVQKWVDGYDAVTIDWTETVARSATFTRAQLASVWPVTPADVIPGSDLSVLLADAAVDMDSDVATIRTTITDVTEGSD
jgi:hypothetical protein